MKVMDIDGDEFAECDYGLVVDNSNSLQELKQKMDLLAQAALQNQTLNFSTIMKLYNSSSLAEKQRMVEKNEQEIMQRQQQAQQQQAQLEQQKLESDAALKERELNAKDQMNIRDNETKILVANISAQSNQNVQEEPQMTEESKAKLDENIRQFNERLKLDRERLAFDKSKAKEDAAIKRASLNKKTANNSQK